jgi:DNA-binding XRE family transcriptional regulator
MGSREGLVAQNRVRELREGKLLTREDLARRARVSLRTVWSVEAGYNSRVETKRSILRALGVARNRYRDVFPYPHGPAAPNSEAGVAAHSDQA